MRRTFIVLFAAGFLAVGLAPAAQARPVPEDQLNQSHAERRNDFWSGNWGRVVGSCKLLGHEHSSQWGKPHRCV